MKNGIRLLGVLFALLLTLNMQGGDNVIEKVGNGVCDCLEACKKEEASVKGKAFQGCVQKAAKPHLKELKKLFLKSGDEDPDMAMMNELAVQMGLALAKKCPAMLEFILEEMPELQGEF